MNFRQIIAAITVAGALAALPITMISSNGTSAGKIGGTKVVTTLGGQGNWPLK